MVEVVLLLEVVVPALGVAALQMEAAMVVEECRRRPYESGGGRADCRDNHDSHAGCLRLATILACRFRSYRNDMWGQLRAMSVWADSKHMKETYVAGP